MKKRIGPDLFRNSVYTDYLLFNNVLKNKNVNSLLLFQEYELKNYLVDFLKKFNINILNINIIRSFTSLNVHFDYLPRIIEFCPNHLKEYLNVLKQKIMNLNYHKLSLVNNLINLIKMNNLKKKIKKNLLENINSKSIETQYKYIKIKKNLLENINSKSIETQYKYIKYMMSNTMMSDYKLLQSEETKSLIKKLDNYYKMYNSVNYNLKFVNSFEYKVYTCFILKVNNKSFSVNSKNLKQYINTTFKNMYKYLINIYHKTQNSKMLDRLKEFKFKILDSPVKKNIKNYIIKKYKNYITNSISNKFNTIPDLYLDEDKNEKKIPQNNKQQKEKKPRYKPIFVINKKTKVETPTNQDSYIASIHASLLNSNNEYYIGTLLKKYSYNGIQRFNSKDNNIVSKIKDLFSMLKFDVTKVFIPLIYDYLPDKRIISVNKEELKKELKKSLDIVYSNNALKVKNTNTIIDVDIDVDTDVGVAKIFEKKIEEIQKNNLRSNMSNLNMNPFYRLIPTFQAGLNNLSSLLHKDNPVSPFYNFRTESFNKDGFFHILIKVINLDAPNNYKSFLHCCKKPIEILLAPKIIKGKGKIDVSRGYLLNFVKNYAEMFDILKEIATYQISYLTECKNNNIDIYSKDFKTSKKDIEIFEKVMINRINLLRKTDSSILEDSEIILSNEEFKFRKE